MVNTKLIPQDNEIGLCEIEKMIRAEGGIIIRLQKTRKHWRVVYKT